MSARTASATKSAISREGLLTVRELAKAMRISVVLVRWRLKNRPEWLPPVTYVDNAPFFDSAAYAEWKLDKLSAPAEIGAPEFGSSTPRSPRSRRRGSTRRSRPHAPVMIDAPARSDLSIDPTGPAPWAD